MGRMQKKHEYSLEVNKINDDLKEKLGREPTVKEIDEIHQGGKVGGEDKADAPEEQAKPASAGKTALAAATPEMASKLAHIDTSDKLARLLLKVLEFPKVKGLDNRGKFNVLQKILKSPLFGHLDKEVKLKGLKQMAATADNAAARVAA
jgi:hypothetical protein